MVLLLTTLKKSYLLYNCLEPFRVKRVDGVYSRDLRQGTQCNVATVASSCDPSINRTESPAPESTLVYS